MLPTDLYDPRVAELSGILDPLTSFPAPELARDELALSMLQQLGLRSAATHETMLQAARYIEQTAQGGDVDTAVVRAKVGQGVGDAPCEVGAPCWG